MDRILEVIRRLAPSSAGWISLAVVIIAAIAFIWYRFGAVPAIVLIVGVLLIWGSVQLYYYLVARREKQKGKAFGKAIGASREEISQATSDWDNKWKEALKTLEESKKGLYELPWYMLVGEPQSGKSTTLRYSGLKFPLGESAIEGGGGTRNCDWWFTNEGVILDTAGRLTMHQSATTDEAEWDHFLGLLGKYRPYCPINGVILVIPADSLLRDDAKEREEKAHTIRERLSNIQKKLAVQFPVYVVITKCDLIFGFTHFFNKSTPEQQREMLGWSLEGEGQSYTTTHFRSSFNTLVERLVKQRQSFLGNPSVRDNREKIYMFPEEFATLEEPLNHYLSFIFEPNIYTDVPFFRGFYFTSGMQEGVPILSAASDLLQGKAQMARLESIFKQQRAFFIRDFYKDKVLPEEGLVTRAAHNLKRDRAKSRFVLAFNIMLLLFGSFLIYRLYSNLNAKLEQPKIAIQNARENFREIDDHFFNADQETRQRIFKSLKDLKQGVAISQDSNRMTAYLENTFAYYYMDRVILGMFDVVATQLNQFQVAAPATPRNSERELETLLNALSELKKWHLHVAKEDPTGFSPNIKPFLALSLNPTWNDDLAALRTDLSLEAQLQEWFESVAKNTTDDVQRYLIEELVRRTEKLFIGLERAVADFYEKQPELVLYQQKVRKSQEMNRLFDGLLSPAPSNEAYLDQMDRLYRLYDTDFQALRTNKADVYLAFDEVREKTIRAIGPAFQSLAQPESEDESLLPSFDSKELRQLPRVTEFTNKLNALDEASFDDPRKLYEPDRDRHFVFPEALLKFESMILNPFFTRYANSANPYQGLPRTEADLRTNLGEILDVGGTRFHTLRLVFETNIYTFAELLEETERVRLTRTMDGFYSELMEREQQQVVSLMQALVQSQETEIPTPPSQWKRLVQDFNGHMKAQPQFGAFTQLPKRIENILTEEFTQEQRLIFGRSNQIIDNTITYRKSATDALDQFVMEINRLVRIPDRDLANQKSLYSGRFPGIRNIEQLQTLESTPEMLTPHAQDLAKWSQMAITSFRNYVGVANPCPECGPAVKQVRDKARQIIDSFPLTYASAVTASESPGTLTIQTKFTPEKELDALLEALEPFREPSDLLNTYVNRLRLAQFFEEALAWADSVRKMRQGQPNINIFFDVPKTNNLGQSNAGSLGSSVTFAEVKGAFKLARGIRIRVPTTTAPVQLQASPDSPDTRTIFEFGNEEQTGDNEEATVVVEDGYLGLAGFMLQGQRQADNRFHRNIQLTLNTDKKVSVTFKFSTNQPIASPPDWSKLLGN